MRMHIFPTMVAVAVLAITCASQPRAQKAAARPGKRRPAASAFIEQKLVAEERRVVWEAVVKKDIRTLQAYFDDRFLDVSDVGVFTKSETIELIPNLNIKDYSLKGFKVIVPKEGTAIITYEAVQHWTIDGKEAPSHVRASSVWVRRGSRWQIIFHQESALNEAASK